MCRVTLFANLKFGFFPNIDTQPNCYCSLSFKFCHSMKDWGQISSTVYSASVYTLFTITLKPTTYIYNATSWWVQHLLFCCYEENNMSKTTHRKKGLCGLQFQKDKNLCWLKSMAASIRHGYWSKMLRDDNPKKILKAERENIHWKYHEDLKPQKCPPSVTYFLQ